MPERAAETSGTRLDPVPPRSAQQRKADTLRRLHTDADGWVATADDEGRPHLVPLSLCWDGRRVIVRVKATSRTARNAHRSGRARLALGDTRDVVVVDATVASVPADQAPEIAAVYAARTGWGASNHAAEHVFLLLVPTRVQAWREVEEFYERTLMMGGRWIT
jgi:hypothetical protein